MDQKLANVLGKAAAAWRDVMSIYAGAMCSAQILEGELVQILAFLRVGSGELKGHHFDLAYKQMTRMKPSEVLNSIRGGGGNLPRDTQETIKRALHDRNFLAHEFFHQYNPVMSAAQCKRIASRLQKVDSNLKGAFNSLQPLRQRLEMRLGLSGERRIFSESFKKQAAEAIASFNDE